MTAVSLTVNGRAIAADVAPRQHLADFIREGLLLTGTHLGCEHGVCGACTVLIDGAPARSCIAFPVALEGAAITTIEGLADDAVMVDLREAFATEHGLQCGFCTPGMLIMARDIVLRRPGADPATIRHELAGNLCRCTGYAGIVRAIASVAERRHGESPVETTGSRILEIAGASPLSLPVTPPAPPAALPRTAAASAVSTVAAASTPLRNPVTLSETFHLDAPRAAVWAFFQDPARVVSCLPGARLTAPSDGRTLDAELVVKLGPIQAVFGGAGVIAADPSAFSGRIEGAGADRRSATRVQARLAYRLQDEDGSTAVIVDVAYVLQGPLAQMSRGALARDLAGRMTRDFANRVSAALAGAPLPEQTAPLDAGALVISTLRAWLSRLFRRI